MTRQTSFIAVTSAIGCSLLLLCLFLASIGGYAYWNAQSPSTSSVDRIAYIDNNENIQIVDARGEQRIAVTTDASSSTQRMYTQPTWSPDSQQIAFIGLQAGRSQNQGTLYTSPAKGGSRTTVYQSNSAFPFYLYWSPDSQQIGFLAQARNEIAFMLGYSDGKKEARKLHTGSPFYWAWAPDGHALLLHVGGSRRDSRDARLALLRWKETEVPQVLKDGPSDFEAPQYSPDGSKILFAATSDTGSDALYLADVQGANTRAVVEYAGRIAFAWSPDGKKIATLTTPEEAGLPNLGPIWISDADGNNRKEITHDDALAFYWSPDSRQIAYLTVVLPSDTKGCANCGRPRGLAAPLTQDDEVRLRWSVANVADGNTITLATFIPTSDLISVLPYFDQYARSLTFWSPDSRRFVYTQAEGNDTSSVLVVEVIANPQPKRIGDGAFAVWSWK